MGGTGVIDRFLGVFTQYIDSGFGLVQGDVRWLAGVLIAIDITLAGLFWVLAPDEDVIARLIRKTLYIGVFAYIIANYNNLAQIIYNSFAGLGIKAGGGTLSSAQPTEQPKPEIEPQVPVVIAAPQPIVNRPNAAQAASNGHADDDAIGPVVGWPERTSTIRPNNTGSANCAPASSRLAPASIQPSRASLPSSSRTRVYRRSSDMKRMLGANA